MTKHRVDEERYLAQWSKLRELVQALPPGEQRDDLAEFVERAWRLPLTEFERDRAEAALADANETFETTVGGSSAKARAACQKLGLVATSAGRRSKLPTLLRQWRRFRIYRDAADDLRVRDPRDTLTLIAAERAQSHDTVARDLRKVKAKLQALLDADPDGDHAALYRLDIEMLDEVPTLWGGVDPI
jgi:hypothetical protein